MDSVHPFTKKNRPQCEGPRIRATLEAQWAGFFLIICYRSATGASVCGRQQLSYLKESSNNLRIIADHYVFTGKCLQKNMNAQQGFHPRRFVLPPKCDNSCQGKTTPEQEIQHVDRVIQLSKRQYNP
jgi:hypothetical protein